MTARLSLLLVIAALLAAAPASAAGRHVVFVDNSRAEEGTGSYEQPFKTVGTAQRLSAGDAVIYVAEGSGPYEESISLKRGQILVGSAYGLEPLRTDMQMELDAPTVAAMRGTGPVIHGAVTLSGDNLVAGITVTTSTVAAISAASAAGPVTIRNCYVRTSNRAQAIVFSALEHPATVAGGSIDATADGNGIAIWNGFGDVTFDGVNVSGAFSNAIDIRGHTRGNIAFRGRGAIRIDDATQRAVTIAGCGGKIEFAVPLQITARSAGLSIQQSNVKISGGSSWIAAANGTALEIRDANVEAAFVSVSASPGEGGRLAEGIVVDKLRGSLVVSGENGRPGSGGTIRDAALHGIAVTQSSNVRLSNMTLADDGVGERAKCDEQIEAKTNLQCRAALFLRHVEHSELSNISISGGKQIGVNGNNLDGVIFGGLEIRNVGDAPSDAAVVLDEVRGEVRFNRCTFEDAAGGAVVAAQQFNAGRLIFDRCAMGAAARSAAAPYLMTLRASSSGRLDVDVRNSELHDNAGGAVLAQAAGAAALRIGIIDSHVQRFGRTAADLSSRDGAQLALVFERADVMTPAVLDRPAVAIAANDTSSACFSVTQSRVYIGGAEPPVRITAAPSAKVSVARGNGEPPGIAAPPNAVSVSACP